MSRAHICSRDTGCFDENLSRTLTTKQATLHNLSDYYSLWICEHFLVRGNVLKLPPVIVWHRFIFANTKLPYSWPLGCIHTWDLLGVNYCVNYLLNNGFYYTKWAHSHFLFGQLLRGLKSSIIGCVPIFLDCMERKVHRCELTFRDRSSFNFPTWGRQSLSIWQKRIIWQFFAENCMKMKEIGPILLCLSQF